MNHKDLVRSVYPNAKIIKAMLPELRYNVRETDICLTWRWYPSQKEAWAYAWEKTERRLLRRLSQ
jgi:hypothetical protein